MKNIILNKFNFRNEGRIFYLDQLRSLAIIGVIAIHVAMIYLKVLDIDSFSWLFSDVFFTLGRFAVPIFLMLSGVLLLNRDYSLPEFFKKRYPRILIPFVFWGIIYVLFVLFFQNKISLFTSLPSGLYFIAKMFLGVGGYLGHVWYVWLILSLYLFVPISINGLNSLPSVR